MEVKPGGVQKGELRRLEIFMKLEGSKGGIERLRELQLGNSKLRRDSRTGHFQSGVSLGTHQAQHMSMRGSF